MAASSPRAPLVPLAAAATVGALAARWLPLSTDLLAGATLLAAGGWWLTRRRQAPRAALVLLLAAAAGLAALGLLVTQEPRTGDVGTWAAQGRPLVRLRGRLVAEPEVRRPEYPELRSQRGEPTTVLLLESLAIDQAERWQPVRGLVRASIGGEVRDWNLGDGIEILGRLSPPLGPSNPGERDYRQALVDQGIFAVLTAKSPAAVTAWPAGAHYGSWRVGLARLRSAVRRALADHLRGQELGVAQALLLGETSALEPPQFESYLRTGVCHVLAISGQHLMLLAVGLGVWLRFTDWPPRRQALLIMSLTVSYALLTGGRPPVFRAAVMVVSFSLAALTWRRANPVNSLALAWLLVFAFNPADIFQTGTQLSFLAVLVLAQGLAPLSLGRPSTDPVERLTRAAQPPWRQAIGAVSRGVLRVYAVTLVVWLTLVPLVAKEFHLFSPVALLLGPPLMVLIGLALMTGFLLLPLSLLGDVAKPVGMLLGGILRTAGRLVEGGQELPGGWWYVAGPTAEQVAVFYLIIVVALVTGWLTQHWRIVGLLLGVWLCWLLGVPRAGHDDLRITVLAVGHGNAAVVETPTGRVLLFDAGSLAGPEVATRVIAPFLWSQGHQRIDEIFLSHADLDHFNGVPALLERFRVGQVSMNPTFADKSIAGVRLVLDRLERSETKLRVLSRGEVLQTGGLQIEVLHPPADGPPGTENARSLVLGLSYGGNRLLLTGDLEPPGLGHLLAQPPWRADVLVAPHHGSVVSNTPALADWVNARLVIISDHVPARDRPEPYTRLGATVWPTFTHGAVLLSSRGTDGWRARSFVTGQTWVAPGQQPVSAPDR